MLRCAPGNHRWPLRGQRHPAIVSPSGGRELGTEQPRECHVSEFREQWLHDIVRGMNAAGLPCTPAKARAMLRKGIRLIEECLCNGTVVNLGGIVLRPAITPDGKATVVGEIEEKALGTRQ